MASRLQLAGMRSISLPVDISNYVMLELGAPLHFYDADKLTGAITVRRANAGEKLTTLDDKERELSAEDLLITDESGALGIAGVMGGAATEVSDSTTRVLIEAAHFDAVSIGRSRRRHKLPSEASKRFERGVDPSIMQIAAQRAVNLLVQLAGGTETTRITDAGAQPADTQIQLPAGFASALIGVDYTDEQTVDSLEGIGATVAQNADGFQVTAPSWRPDLAIKEDLVEEVARVVGYDKIPATLPVAPPGRGLTRAQSQRRRLLQGLADAGLTEILSYPFVSELQNNTFGAATAGTAVKAISLANPISKEFRFLRTSLLPGLLDTARRNIGRGFRDLALYEGGLVFLPGEQLGSSVLPPLGAKPSDEVLAELFNGVPRQPWHLAAVLTGHEASAAAGFEPRAWDWADALDTAQGVAGILGVQLEVVQGSHQGFHPGRAAQLMVAGEVVGYAGELHPQLLKDWDLPARTVAMELNAAALMDAAPAVVVAQHLSSQPLATQDVALVVDQDVVAGEVLAALREGAGELLEDIALFDVYQGKGIEDGKKSLAFGLRFRATDRTLTADEASEARAAAVAVAAEKFGATQR